MACGVPVVAYKRGGISEIVKSGQTGWLVKPDSIEEMVKAVSNLDKIDRFDCRLQAENEYSLEALGNRLEEWIRKIISH